MNSEVRQTMRIALLEYRSKQERQAAKWKETSPIYARFMQDAEAADQALAALDEPQWETLSTLRRMIDLSPAFLSMSQCQMLVDAGWQLRRLTPLPEEDEA